MSLPVTTVSAVEKSENKPKSVEYTVKAGDYLDKLAKEHDTTWNRLWNKNGFITNPDLIFPGDKIMIPSPEEVVPERTLPAQPRVVAAQNTPSEAFSAPVRAVGGHNAYSYGYCTWYVKNLRPDIGSFWGDGSNWYSAAQAAGYATGTQPQAGAIGVATGYNHVVYVNSVDGNTVHISEMNYEGWNVASSRTASSSEFVYIY